MEAGQGDELPDEAQLGQALVEVLHLLRAEAGHVLMGHMGRGARGQGMIERGEEGRLLRAGMEESPTMARGLMDVEVRLV